jgi:hypothetical protein
VNRLEQLEAAQRIEAMQYNQLSQTIGDMHALLTQAIREKREAEQGLQAAQEALQKIREQQPVSPEERQAIIQKLQQEAIEQMRTKSAKFQEAIRHSRKVDVFNSGDPVLLQMNGIRCIVPTGRSEVSELFLPAWEEHIQSMQRAAMFDQQIKGSVPYGDLEAWRFKQQPEMDIALVPGSKVKPRTSLDWGEDVGVM